MMGFGFGFGLLGLLLMVLFWGGLILLAVLLVRALFRGNRGSFTAASGHTETPREILDQRYARGEITREQYELMKKDLS
jgi:putative membrane protein